MTELGTQRSKLMPAQLFASNRKKKRSFEVLHVLSNDTV
jgi:hypothetical protein